MSTYEEQIMKILLKAKINFIREKSFSDLKNGKFRYDFFIPDKKAIIEVNGEQHYYYIKHFYKSVSDFKKAQENDRRKISYALANQYTIYCIPYWEINNISSIKDIFNSKFKATSRWHNDNIWKIKKIEKNN